MIEKQWQLWQSCNILFLTQRIPQERARKLQNLDEKAMNDIAKELEGEETNGQADGKKQQQKKKTQLQQRLAAERKGKAKSKTNTKQKEDDDVDDDVDENLETFAKGARAKKTK